MRVEVLESADHLRLHEHDLGLVPIPQDVFGELAAAQEVGEVQSKKFLLCSQHLGEQVAVACVTSESATSFQLSHCLPHPMQERGTDGSWLFRQELQLDKGEDGR